MSYRLLCLVLLVCAVPPLAPAQAKPRVRAITAFVRLDRDHYQSQVRDAVSFLRRAQAAYQGAGYEVQTLRITTQPFPEYTRGLSHQQAFEFFRGLDELAQKQGFITSVGPAMLSDSDDPAQADLLSQVLANAKNLSGSIVIAGDDGLHWKSISAAARAIRYLAEHSPGGQANFNFAATAMLPAYGPFFPGSYFTGGGHQFAIGLESANVVLDAFSPGQDFSSARSSLAQKLTAAVTPIEKIATTLAAQTGWQYDGLDVSPAPSGEISIGAAIEKLTGAPFGSSGTLSAAALITSVLRQLPVKRAGYSGLMMPILEDSTLARRWAEGHIAIDGLLAYSSVCGTGLDTIPLPGDVSTRQIERMLSDTASLAYKWNKPLSGRLLPVPGKGPGDRTIFDDPHLVNTVLRPLP
ncbi:MAG TPA: DUF711 family protein [Terriglobales bacterium]|nr:DUF711 family protein [Terriglobales bacterium]